MYVCNSIRSINKISEFFCFIQQLQKLNDTIEMLKNEKYELEENMKMKEHKLQTITTDFQNQHSGEREDFEAQLDECGRQKERMESEIEQLNAK